MTGEQVEGRQKGGRGRGETKKGQMRKGAKGEGMLSLQKGWLVMRTIATSPNALRPPSAPSRPGDIELTARLVPRQSGYTAFLAPRLLASYKRTSFETSERCVACHSIQSRLHEPWKRLDTFLIGRKEPEKEMGFRRNRTRAGKEVSLAQGALQTRHPTQEIKARLKEPRRTFLLYVSFICKDSPVTFVFDSFY